MKNGALGQGRLGSTGATLEHLDAAATVGAALLSLTAWATETVGPARLLKDRLTLGFGAILSEELVQTQACLELDSVGLHGLPPGVYARRIGRNCVILCHFRTPAEDWY